MPLPDRAVSCHAAIGETPPCDATSSDTSSYRHKGKISFMSPTALQSESFPDGSKKREPIALHSTYPSHFSSHFSKSTSALFSWILASVGEGPTTLDLSTRWGSSSLSALFWFLYITSQWWMALGKSPRGRADAEPFSLSLLLSRKEKRNHRGANLRDREGEIRAAMSPWSFGSWTQKASTVRVWLPWAPTPQSNPSNLAGKHSPPHSHSPHGPMKEREEGASSYSWTKTRTSSCSS